MVFLMHEKWYICDTKPQVIEEVASKPRSQINQLDVQILNDRILKPILNIQDVRQS